MMLKAIMAVGLFSAAAYFMVVGLSLEYAVMVSNYGDFLMRHGEPFLVMGLAAIVGVQATITTREVSR